MVFNVLQYFLYVRPDLSGLFTEVNIAFKVEVAEGYFDSLAIPCYFILVSVRQQQRTEEEEDHPFLCILGCVFLDVSECTAEGAEVLFEFSCLLRIFDGCYHFVSVITGFGGKIIKG